MCVLALLLLLACAAGTADEALLRFSGLPPSNVLMLSIDSLRRDHLGRYGGAALPELDRLLSEGIVLEDHRSCSSWTYHSATCALTGGDQLSAGFMPQRLEGRVVPEIPAEATPIAELLRDRGWVTGLVSGNSFIGDPNGLDRGYEQIRIEALEPAERIIEQGLALLDPMQDTSRPWFLHLHFMDPHMPYDPPAAYLEDLPESEFSLIRHADFKEVFSRWDELDEAARERARADALARYGGEVRYLDDQLGLLMDALEARGALDDTLVVIWSDHGEMFFERDLYAHGNGVFYEENAAIAAFWARDLEPAVFTGMSSHEDLLPTLAHALGLSNLAPVEGRVLGAEERSRRFADSYDTVLDRTQQSVEDGGWRLVYSWNGTLRLYDLGADPGENQDLFAPEHPQVQRLWPLLEPRIQAADALIASPDPVPPGL